MSSERVELLKNMPIFGGLGADTLGLILELSRSVVVREGDFFFRQGGEGNSAFILERGQVSVFKSWEGREYLLRPLGSP